VAGEGGELLRREELLSDIVLVDDAFVSPAEWELEVSPHDPDRFRLRNRSTGEYLGRRGLTEDEDRAAVVALYPVDGCAPHPELTLDAEGEVGRTHFDDGDLFGIVDTHSHIFTNFGFGGGGIYHGAPEGNEAVYLERYERHNREVLEYFRDRPDDFLMMDFAAGDGWDKLCPFLGEKKPRQPFPHANKATRREWEKSWSFRLLRKTKRLARRALGR